MRSCYNTLPPLGPSTAASMSDSDEIVMTETKKATSAYFAEAEPKAKKESGKERSKAKKASYDEYDEEEEPDEPDEDASEDEKARSRQATLVSPRLAPPPLTRPVSAQEEEEAR